MTDEALKPEEVEYIQLWLKAVELLSPEDYTKLSEYLNLGSSLTREEIDEVNRESERLRQNKQKLRALLEEHQKLSYQAQAIAQTQELKPPSSGVSASPEQRHLERVSDLVTALLTALNRDISRYPDLKRIMYDLVDKGAAKRRPNQ